jgi:ribose transport system permease protein
MRTEGSPAAAPSPRAAPILRFLRGNPQLVILILIVVVFSILFPAFISKKNVINILKQSTVISLVSCGLALVVISGNLDLSVGALLSFTLGISLSLSNINPLLALFVPLLLGVGLGMLNGTIVSRFEVNSIIVTLGSLSLISGFVQFYRKGNIIMGLPGTFLTQFVDLNVFSIPSYVLVYVAVAVVCGLLLSRTTYGRKLRLIGVNREAALVGGINVQRVTTAAFVIASTLTALAAIIQGARLLQGSTNTGDGLEFDALTALLIGGVSLRGGKGSILNAMIGVLLLAVIINALTLLNVPFEWRNIAKGLLILIAVGTEALARWRSEK